MRIQFQGLPTDQVAETRQSGRDAYGQPVEVHPATGDAYPCRHCLGETPLGRDYLILAWRPFRSTNPYAETGPIFLCADDCKAAKPSARVPAILRSPSYLVRGYTDDERILYGTGQVTLTPDIPGYASKLLEDSRIAFVDVRSASNNCFQCRVVRAK
ncbi:MAG: DUF1203 domain-containing protein [Pseudomonadota bacterium]